MKGKALEFVVTDGNGGMRKAIKKVFPMTYHHLCAWHLLQNATSNLANSIFTSEFKKCILSYYEVSEFEARWERLVTELQLQNNRWVCDLYDWRKMWVIARIRGHFFGRFWTTSKYEGLHSTLGNFFHSHHNLKDFIEQFFHCVSEMRSQQTQSDMHSMVGHLVLQSPLHDLEVYCKITNEGDISLVSANAVTCMYIKGLVLIESLGIPCDHIAALLVHLDFMEIPMSFALERWSKNARSKRGKINLKWSLRRTQQDHSIKARYQCWAFPTRGCQPIIHTRGCVQYPLVVRRKKRPKKDSINHTLGQQPSHEDDVDEDNYYTPNFGEEVDEVYALTTLNPWSRRNTFLQMKRTSKCH
ncbi:Protein FAR1-RELATED SEQUENCE [Arachis hypogaea]|nr:Protein FAR1-RELATED SEQUENCE [Arachis hypogaea]